MSDVKLFRIGDEAAEEFIGQPIRFEKKLQVLVEKHLEALLRIRFVASEHSTGKKHGGRIDTLGLDENFCPTIIEYKRNSNANVINQGLFYLDWLMDHQGSFELLVQKVLGHNAATRIDWSAPRLLCIAEDFGRYDIHVIHQINRNIELVRYKLFGDDLLLLDLVNVVSAEGKEVPDDGDTPPISPPDIHRTTQDEALERASPALTELYEAARDYITGLGDDIQERFLKYYIAYKRLKNFACICLQTGKNRLLMYLPLDPDTVPLEEGFSCSVRGKGHHGTGDLELTIGSLDDLEKAKPLIQKSFEEN
jgi:predicted transport protein